MTSECWRASYVKPHAQAKLHFIRLAGVGLALIASNCHEYNVPGSTICKNSSVLARVCSSWAKTFGPRVMAASVNGKLKSKLVGALLKTMNHRGAAIFCTEVPATVPDYYAIISRPIHFGQIKTKLESKEGYSTVG